MTEFLNDRSFFMKKIPLVDEALELYATTPEGLPLWKTKGVKLNCENLLDNIFALSCDIADYFGILHKHLLSQNISKLQKEKHLPNHRPNFRRMVGIGSSAKRVQAIYAFTRHQTELLIMDFSGTKARQAKIAIIKRLQAIEADVLKGAFDQARQKAATWDGVQLLTDLGFTHSLPNKMATRKDIAKFLNIPESTLAVFLSKHTDQITVTKLTKEQIRAAGSKANRLNAYTQDEVFKIAFWMNTEIGSQLKKKIFGDVGVYSTPAIKEETEWKAILSKIFANLGFQYQYKIGNYVVDFFVEKLNLVLECDTNNHRYYNQQEEEQRDAFISQHYTLIRFNSQIVLETLVNGILRAQPKQVIKLYLPPELKKATK